MASDMEAKKRVILSMIKFLENEVDESQLSEEKKESIEVAIQCLDSAYDISTVREQLESQTVNLMEKVAENKASVQQVSEAAIKEAEDCKVQGNSAMTEQKFAEALVFYTRAIALNPNNAVYFCNRAAVYSKMEKHLDAIRDCKEAIRLDPTYGKAYGRLGIAYTNLNLFTEAKKAYETALKYDPKNEMYKSNLQLAESRMASDGVPAGGSQLPFDLGSFMNNPALINMATQMLGDPRFRNMMSGIMNVNQTENPNFEALFQVGQTLANQMQDSDPNFVDNLRRSFGQPPDANGDSANNGPSSPPENEK